MTGKTHLAVGIATALLVIRPMTLSSVAVCAGGAIIGSVISDIDVKTSDSRNAVNKVLGVMALFAIVEGFINYKFQLNILNILLEDSNMYRFITGLAILLVACIICKELPHRSFMHSAIGVLSFGFIIYYISPDMMMPFSVSMVSHIVLDMLNKKEVRIWYPYKKGVSMKLCKSDGVINNLLCIIGLLVCGGYLYFFIKS